MRIVFTLWILIARTFLLLVRCAQNEAKQAHCRGVLLTARSALLLLLQLLVVLVAYKRFFQHPVLGGVRKRNHRRVLLTLAQVLPSGCHVLLRHLSRTQGPVVLGLSQISANE